ncbi:Peptide hydrolase, partial [Tolypocladium paradoxum]
MASMTLPWQRLTDYDRLEGNTVGDAEDNLSYATRAPGVTVFDEQAANFTMIYDAGTYLSGSSKGSTWTGQYFEGNNYYIYIHGKGDPKGDWWLSEASYASSGATGGVLVNCHFDSVATSYGAWSDANNPKAIPALHRLQQYLPSWAIATKRGFSLVEVKRNTR